MVSRERLLSLGATAAGYLNTVRKRRVAQLVGRGIALALLVVLALRLWQLWRREPVDFGHVDAAVFVLAAGASVVAVTAYGLVWLYLLRCLGTPAPYSWITIFFKSQLGKYLPGSVWQYAGRVGLAHSRGVPIQRGLISVIAEIGYSAFAAAAASSLILGWAAAAGVGAGVAVVLALAVVIRRRLPALLRRTAPFTRGGRLDRENLAGALSAAPAAIALYLVVWGLYGITFWATARALFSVPVSDLGRYIGVFALGWLAGLVAVFAPGGIGVREAVIAALLSSRLGEANAIVLAGTSRIVLTVIDLSAAAVSFGVPALRRREARPVGAGQ